MVASVRLETCVLLCLNLQYARAHLDDRVRLLPVKTPGVDAAPATASPPDHTSLGLGLVNWGAVHTLLSRRLLRHRYSGPWHATVIVTCVLRRAPLHGASCNDPLRQRRTDNTRGGRGRAQECFYCFWASETKPNNQKHTEPEVVKRHLQFLSNRSDCIVGLDSLMMWSLAAVRGACCTLRSCGNDITLLVEHGVVSWCRGVVAARAEIDCTSHRW